MAARELPYFYVCIILEGRSEMNKKILGAAVTVMFSICLIVTSNMKESDGKETVTVSETYTQKAAEQNKELAAGASLVLSKYSFTTESDEKASIKRNETTIVATPGEVIPETAEPELAVIEETEEIEAETEIKETEEIIETEIYENRWGITLTEEEIDLLARIVWLESNAESDMGQQAVVEVVFNRMASELYPNTLYDVLSQKNPVQFCSWKNRDIARPTEKEYQNIKEVLSGNTNILRNDTLYFSTKALTPNLDIRIGGHSFCY